MSGVFPLDFDLSGKPRAHGYTILEVVGSNPFYPKGTALKGHEFHYSGVTGFIRGQDPAFAFRMKRGEGIIDKMDGICYKNVLATYTHLHAYGSAEWADGLIGAAVSYKQKRKVI